MSTDAIEAKSLASPISSIASLSKTIVGAGMLAIPYAFRADGILLGILIIILAGITSAFGLYVQLRTSKFLPEGHATFFGICSITYPNLSLVFDLSIFLQCFGCCISYLVIVGDLLPDLIAHEAFTRSWAIVSSAVIIAPLCYFKNLDSLKYTSILGLAAIAYLFVLVVAHYVVGDVPQELKGDVSVFKPLSLSSILSTFSIIIFAFTGHQNMYSIINESRDKSSKNILFVISTVMSGSVVLFLVIGLAGYMTFGSNVSGNVVLMYNSAIVNLIGRYAIILMVILSLPLMFHPCRLSANNFIYFTKITYLHKKPNTAVSEETPLLNDDTNPRANDINDAALTQKPVIVPFSHTTFVVLTTVLLLAAYILALSVTSFALVLSLVGATGSTAISFILPGLFGYKLLGNDPASSTYKEDRLVKQLSLLLTVWGVFVMVLCVSATLWFA